jgi:hypothetical protein
MVLQRKESEHHGNMAVAVLCLLEVSSSGLLQTELRTILSDEKTPMPPSPFDEKGKYIFFCLSVDYIVLYGNDNCHLRRTDLCSCSYMYCKTHHDEMLPE